MSGYRFDEYRVDPALRELSRGDQRIVLPPQVFDFLAYLIEHRDRAVGRDEVVAAVWGKTEVSDTLLGQTVLRIRRELGDDAKEQRILRTIPRFGYRWVAPLQIDDPDDTAIATRPAIEVGAAAPARAVRTSGWPARILVGSSIAILLLIGFAVFTQRAQKPSMVQTDALVSAVLPATVEPGAESSWMRLGVMDVVATQLRSSGLPSVPSENVVALLNAPGANRNGSLREVTSASLLITPQVHHAGTKWQVDLDADDGAGKRYSAGASAGDVTKAARDAANKLLTALGRRTADLTETAPYTALIGRVDAAILADDPDSARTLIEHASAEERQAPELRLLEAKLDFRAGRLDAARERLLALLDEAPAKTAPVLRASILNGLGAAAIRSDKPDDAARSFGEAIELLAPPHTDPAQLGQAYLGRAAAAADQRHFEAAAADYARARIAMRQANDTLALVRVAADEGFVDLDQDRPAQALPQLSAAADGFKQWGALNEAIYTYIGQINCHLALLDGRAAMQVADAANSLGQRIDNPTTLASLTIARARALAAVGRLREARDSLDRLRSSATDEIAIAASGAVLARLELDNNNPAIAGDLAEHAVAALGAPSYAGQRADAWLTQVRAELRKTDAAKAEQSIVALAAWAARGDDRRATVYASLARAEFALRFGDGKSWRSDFETARQLAERGGVPLEIAAVARGYAIALIATDDLPAAAVEVGRVSRWSEQDFGCAVLEARLYAALGKDAARQTAVARASSLAGERPIPVEALAMPISTRSAAQ